MSSCRIDLAGAVDEDAGEVRVGHDGCITRVLIVEPRERVEVGLVVDVQPVFLDRRVELMRLEEAVRACASEDGDAVGRGLQLVGQVALDALDIGAEAGVLGRVRPVGAQPLPKGLPQELVEVIAPGAVRPRVQIQAQDRERHRLERGKSIDGFSQKHGRGLVRRRCRTSLGCNLRSATAARQAARTGHWCGVLFTAVVSMTPVVSAMAPRA